MEKKVKVTLIRSTIGCTKKQKDTVAALGLKKIGKENTVPDNACSQGMLALVAHLVKVEMV
ncbi:MAG: 50S ribosomal protein L30 [Clostridia bacterium]